MNDSQNINPSSPQYQEDMLTDDELQSLKEFQIYVSNETKRLLKEMDLEQSTNLPKDSFKS
jgi:hypothetical protein